MIAYLVDAFTENRFEGNRAGVVFDADDLTPPEKQQIAAEVGAPESAFISRSAVADYKVEFFTPTTEVNFCGHATIATFHMLAALGRVDSSRGTVPLTQETKAGVLPVSIEMRGEKILVMMKQRKPQFKELAASAAAVADALNITENDLHPKLPIAVSNTGNWHLMIPVRYKEILDAMTYDAEKLSAVLRPAEAITAHVFVHGEDNHYDARNFCPTIGISEDPATGAAAGAFGAYLAREKVLAERENHIRITQGEAMGRPSQLAVCITVNTDGAVQDVEVSGTATASFALSSDILGARALTQTSAR